MAIRGTIIDTVSFECNFYRMTTPVFTEINNDDMFLFQISQKKTFHYISGK